MISLIFAVLAAQAVAETQAVQATLQSCALENGRYVCLYAVPDIVIVPVPGADIVADAPAVVLGSSVDAEAPSPETGAQDEPTPSPQSASLGHFTPFATISVQGAFGTPNEVLGLYVFWTGSRAEEGRKGFAVRRLLRSTTSETGVGWATSFDCRGLEDVIVELETTPMPMIDVPTAGAEYSPSLVADGVTYRLWSRYPTWSGASGYSVEVSSNVGTPLADWSQRLRSVVASCWSDRMPEAVGGPSLAGSSSASS